MFRSLAKIETLNRGIVVFNPVMVDDYLLHGGGSSFRLIDNPILNPFTRWLMPDDILGLVRRGLASRFV